MELSLTDKNYDGFKRMKFDQNGSSSLEDETGNLFD
jgi:hypothetical protein